MDKIYVVNDKNSFIKSNEISNSKVFNYNEFRDNLIGSYNMDAIIYVMKKYNVKVEIAKIMISNLKFIDGDSSNKVSNLVELKKELESYRSDTAIFNNYLKNKEVVFDNRILSSDLGRVVDIVSKLGSVTYHKIDGSNIHNIYIVKDILEEVFFVSNKIVSLIKSGVNSNNIYLSNLNDDYRNYIGWVFPMFNINFNVNSDCSIKSTTVYRDFINSYSDDYCRNFSGSDDISLKIIRVLNKYVNYNFDEVKELVINDLNKLSVSKDKYIEAVNEVDLLSDEFRDEDYVFILGFNQGEFPSIFKDELYLNDIELESIGMYSSNHMNSMSKDIYSNIIKSIKNVVITSKLIVGKSEGVVANLNDILKYEVIKEEYDFNNSIKFNKFMLARHINNFSKYGVINSELITLYSNYPQVKVNSFDNQFNGIDKDLLKSYLNGKYNLSYSSMNNYYLCSYKYYLNNVLNLDKFDKNFSTEIGTIFHAVLQYYFKDGGDINEIWNRYVEHIVDNKERFFLKKLRSELDYIVKFIEQFNENSLLKDSLFEENVEFKIPSDMDVTFKGFIDKINYKDGVVSIIDYKTGRDSFDINKCNHGLSLQLPVYLYLVKNTEKFKDSRVAGFYLHNIIKNEINYDSKKSYEDIKLENLKLNGYTNSDYSITEMIDPGYDNSRFIKGLKLGKEGFYKFSNVISDEQINKLVELVDTKVKEAINNINDGNFMINPKEMDNKNISCNYCKFRDICSMKNDDVVKLLNEKVDFMGGEVNEND